jgi:hypothetical protein
MPTVQKQFRKIVKIPLDYEPEDRLMRFTESPYLYLELLENKAKVRPELRDKDYVPNDTVIQRKEEKREEKKDSNVTSNSHSLDKKEVEKSEREKRERDEYEQKLREELGKKEKEKKDDRGKEEKEKDDRGKEKDDRGKEKDDRGKEKDDRGKEISKERYRPPSDNDYYDKLAEKQKHEYNALRSIPKHRTDGHHHRHHHDEERREKHKEDHESRNESRPKSKHESKHESRNESRPKSKHESKHESRNESKHESKKKRSLYHHSSETEEQQRDEKKKLELEQELKYGKTKDDGGSNKEHHHSFSASPNKYNRPPTLSEISKGEPLPTCLIGNQQVRDISRLSKEHPDEMVRRRELDWKFDKLKEIYEGADFKKPSDYMDLREAQNVYDDTVRRLQLKSEILEYERYLRLGFLAAEYGLQFMGFDMSGFSNHQILFKNKYRALLVELGEKSYLSGPSNIPVEIRLIGLILIQAVLFIVIKSATKRFGPLAGNLIYNLIEPKGTVPETMTQTAPHPPTTQPPQPPQPQKSKMRGPNIKLSEFVNLDDNKKNN